MFTPERIAEIAAMCENFREAENGGRKMTLELAKEYIEASMTLLPALAAEWRQMREVVEAAKYRRELVNRRIELRLNNRPGQFIPELGDLIVAIGHADTLLAEALDALERGQSDEQTTRP